MRWRRGLLRLWLVASVVWLLITGAAFGVPQSLLNVMSPPDLDVLGKVVGPAPKIVPSDDPFAKYEKPAPTLFETHATAIANLRGFLLVGIGFPVGAFVLGIAGWWVVRGFKPAP